MNGKLRFKAGLFAALIAGATLVGCGQNSAVEADIENKEQRLAQLRQQAAELEAEIAQANSAPPAQAPPPAPAPKPAPQRAATTPAPPRAAAAKNAS